MPFVAFAVIAVLGAVAARLLVRPVGPARLARVASRLGLATDAHGELTTYLRATRIARLWGVIAGAVVSIVATYRSESGFRVNYVAILVGWLIGAGLAEVSLRREPAAGRPAVPTWVRLAPPVASMLAVAVTAGVHAAGGDAWWWAVGALCAAAYTMALNGFVSRRAIPGAATSVETARYSIGAISGAGVALIAVCASSAVGVLGENQHLSRQATVTVIGVCFALAAVALAWLVANGTWADSITPRAQLGAVATVVVLLGGSLVGGWWHERPPFGPGAVHPTAAIRVTSESTLDADAAALGVDMKGMGGVLDSQTFIGRLDFAVPEAASGAGTYYLIAIDRRTNSVVPWFGSKAGGGWGSVLSFLPERIPWLAGVRPWTRSGPSDTVPTMFTMGASAVIVKPDQGRVEFMGSVDPSPGFDRSLLTLLLVFLGPNDQMYWSTIVPTS